MNGSFGSAWDRVCAYLLATPEMTALSALSSRSLKRQNLHFPPSLGGVLRLAALQSQT